MTRRATSRTRLVTVHVSTPKELPQRPVPTVGPVPIVRLRGEVTQTMAARWTPPRMWEGQTAYIIGGGPSVRDMDLTPIHNQKVIGINTSFKLGPWVDICWFGDERWWRWNHEALQGFGGLVVTCCPILSGKCPWVHVMARGKPEGIDKRPGFVSWNGNSGASGINFAYHLGVKRIVLIGFDMKRVEGAPCGGHNWHDEHTKHFVPRNDIYQVKFLRYWAAIARDAQALGLEVLNATPGSAIKELPIVNLLDTLPVQGEGDGGSEAELHGSERGLSSQIAEGSRTAQDTGLGSRSPAQAPTTPPNQPMQPQL